MNMLKSAARGYVLAETLLALLLLSLLLLQSGAVVYPLVAGITRTYDYTEAGYVGLAVLEEVLAAEPGSPLIGFGAQELPGLLPFDHDYQIRLERSAFPDLPGLDQYTVTVSRGEKELLRLTTLRGEL
jgi:hypothetical protein